MDTTKRYYRELLDSDRVEGEHPVDRLVAELPEVRDIDEAARAGAAEMSKSAARRRSATYWAEYEDLRFRQRCVREERFFDVGYEMGRLAGIAEYGAFADSRSSVSLRRQVHRVLVSSPLSCAEKAMNLLEVARAFIGGLQGDDPETTSR
jgi:hypothetical protein